jgi:ATP-dependent RNA helicase MSS116, mitochondrial
MQRLLHAPCLARQEIVPFRWVSLENFQTRSYLKHVDFRFLANSLPFPDHATPLLLFLRLVLFLLFAMLAVARGRQALSRALQSCVSPTHSSLLATSSPQWQRIVPYTSRLPVPARFFVSFSRLQQQATAAQPDPETPPELTRFDELAEHGIISPKVIETIVNRMGIHTMTDVQRMTINECLDGADVIAQARTGTGKTLAFLMPIVQRILRDPNLEQRGGRHGNQADASDIRALIISPTRELAEQIAVEARKIVNNTAVKVQTAVGGSEKRYHLQRMRREGCHILVGTPGRMKDILSDSYSGVRLDNLETFVMDEADRLLDDGFLPDIQEIQSFMPPRHEKERQTLMFSATVPKEVVSLVRQTLRPDFKFIRTVDPDEAPTHARIPQKVVFLQGLQNQLPALLELATNAIEANKRDPANNLPFKAIVYFGSTNEVTLASQVFQNMRDPGATGGRSMFAQHPLHPTQILEMHSRLTQRERTNNSARFRNAESAILFSSDVTARGMDFPNVSHVIQIGLPRQADDYVHRLGRTGRAGKSGEGWLLIINDERNEYRRKMGHSGIKIDQSRDLYTAELDMTQGAQLPENIAKVMQMIESGIKSIPFSLKAQTYTSLLGVLGQSGGRSKQAIIDLINDLARYGWGLEKPPGISRGLAGKLGFSNCSGVELDDKFDRDGGRSPFGGDRGGRGGRGGFNERDPFGQGLDSGRGVSRGGERGGFGDGGRRSVSRGGERGGFGDGGRQSGGRDSFGGGRDNGRDNWRDNGRSGRFGR